VHFFLTVGPSLIVQCEFTRNKHSSVLWLFIALCCCMGYS